MARRLARLRGDLVPLHARQVCDRALSRQERRRRFLRRRGPLVILLLWVYYSSLIFFFGAEFTQVYSRTYGSRVGKATNKEEDKTTGVLPVGKRPTGASGASSKAPAPPKTLMPIPVPAEVWTRERLRADLQSSQLPGSDDTGWGRILFGGGLIATALILAVRLIRR